MSPEMIAGRPVLRAGLIGALALAALVPGSPAATAASPPLACLLVNGQTQAPGNPPTAAPMMVTGTASSYDQNTASNNALGAWSQQAILRSGNNAYGNWFKAQNKSTSCTSTKPTFQWYYTCKATAQPCQ